jgi:DNA-binding SARP family transcriptional activator
VLEYRLLGPLEVVGEGGPLALGGQRQRALLAALLLEAGRVVSTDRLVELVYGGDPPRTATTSLQNAIAGLRKLLGPETVETRSPGYVLRVERRQTDAGRFEHLLELARSAAGDERRQLLLDALALWRGPALAEFAYDDFAQAETRRLEELRLVALEERIGVDIELGRHADVVGELEALVAEHRLRERFSALRMLALYRGGRQAEALDAYQAARQALVDELGIEPGDELQDLHHRILRHDAGLAAGPASGGTAAHDAEILKAVLSGRVVPVLGLAGATDLAESLATAFDYPRDRPLDLARVSQYVATMRGSGPLYDELHARYEAAVEPGPLHRFLASLPRLARERGSPYPLIVTTNYDLALEQAFADAGEEIDVVAYVASGPHRGRFWHRRPDEPPQPIDVPNTYAVELSLERRPVLLKLRGAVDTQPEREWESFVITEDDYIDYLGRADLAGAVPVGLAAKLRRSHFLFLGYEMADWNLRLIVGRIWGDRAVAYGSWAVQPSPTPLERAFWRRWDVDVVEADPEAYVALLAALVGRNGA